MGRIKKWKNDKGNLCFSYDRAEAMAKPWIIFVVFILFAGIIFWEYFTYESFITIFPLSFIFLFLFMYWAFYPLKSNEKINEEIINKNVDLRLHNTIRSYDKGVYEVRRKLYYESKGTYGEIVGIYMLVLLSNKDILVYEIKHHTDSGENDAYFEFVCVPKVEQSSKYRKIIDKKTWKQYYLDWKIPLNVKLTMLLLTLTFIGISLIILTCIIISNFKKGIVLYLFGYIIVFSLFSFLNTRFSNIAIKFFYLIISIPYLIISLWTRLIHPFYVIITSYLILGFLVFGIPFIVVRLIDLCLKLSFSIATVLFLVFTIGAICSVYASKITHWIIRYYSPLKDWGNHDYEALNIELSLYVLHRNNINFLIYFSYFLYLFVSGFLIIQYNRFLFTEEIDGAILKSFLVFIAFSNVIAKSKEVDLETKPLLEKVLKLMIK